MESFLYFTSKRVSLLSKVERCHSLPLVSHATSDGAHDQLDRSFCGPFASLCAISRQPTGATELGQQVEQHGETYLRR
jgi:hypothetical protein